MVSWPQDIVVWTNVVSTVGSPSSVLGSNTVCTFWAGVWLNWQSFVGHVECIFKQLGFAFPGKKKSMPFKQWWLVYKYIWWKIENTETKSNKSQNNSCCNPSMVKTWLRILKTPKSGCPRSRSSQWHSETKGHTYSEPEKMADFHQIHQAALRTWKQHFKIITFLKIQQSNPQKTKPTKLLGIFQKKVTPDARCRHTSAALGALGGDVTWSDRARARQKRSPGRPGERARSDSDRNLRPVSGGQVVKALGSSWIRKKRIHRFDWTERAWTKKRVLWC